jgi:hypothetical protein
MARLAAALVVVCLSLLVLTSTHTPTAIAMSATSTSTSSSCPPETSSCVQQSFPCTAPANCTISVSAGPVSNVGQNQASYVEVTGAPANDEVEVAYCSTKAGSVNAEDQPQCAAAIIESGGTITQEPLQYEYGLVTPNPSGGATQTVLAIPTDFDPVGNPPIISQTGEQLITEGNKTGTFFCDNAANPCGVEVMDIPSSQIGNLNGEGFPPGRPSFSVSSTIFPLTFNEGLSGCGSAPELSVDASYSAAQFLPAAGQATCTGKGGVAVVPTELPSVDAAGCATGSVSGCPIHDVIDGTVPVTFTDDPEDPATAAELKQAGGKFAFIPIAASATEIAFSGAAGISLGGNATLFPLDSYQLTPAQAAGIMTQIWDSPVASAGIPNDDVCAELTSKPCKEQTDTVPTQLLVETANGKTDNLDVSQASTTSSATITFNSTYYSARGDNYPLGIGQPVGSGATVYYGDTGYALLNPWQFSYGGQPVQEQNLGAMWPSTPSGATFQTTSWMCAAPNTPYAVTLPWPKGGTQSGLSDILSGQQLLANAEQDPVYAPGTQNGASGGSLYHWVQSPPNECQALSNLPIDFNTQSAGTNYLYNPSSSPLTAAHTMKAAVTFYGQSGGFAFTAMDSSEANFFGLLPATLQNAAGAFVGPSPAGVTAALNDATTNPDGTISPNYSDTGDSAAYPMPQVTYALVSTSAKRTSTQATQLKDLLTNLVTYSHNGGTTGEPLPAGYAPLPATMYTQALSDISKDIVGSGGPSQGGSVGTGGSGGTGSSSPSANSAEGGTGFGPSTSSVYPTEGLGGGALLGRGTGHGSAHGTTATAASSGGSSSAPSDFVGRFITVSLGDSRYVVPGLILMALFCLVVGPLLYMSSALRKRRLAVASSEGPDESLSGPGPPEEPG